LGVLAVDKWGTSCGRCGDNLLGRVLLAPAGVADEVPAGIDVGVPGALVAIRAAVDVVLLGLDYPCCLRASPLARHGVVAPLAEVDGGLGQ